MTMSNLNAAVEISRALGHPARLRIVAMLRSGELCVCQIVAVLGLSELLRPLVTTVYTGGA